MSSMWAFGEQCVVVVLRALSNKDHHGKPTNLPLGFPLMSTVQILRELPHLSHADRRQIVRRLIELEEEAQTLADADRRAEANFQMLDALEAEEHAR